jgi:hypothetical protein
VPSRKGNPFRLYDDEALFARQQSGRAAKRRALEAMRALPAHRKSTLAAQMQAGTAGQEGTSNPRRFTSKRSDLRWD